MIEEVEFHTGVDEPLGFACRLLRKASRQGARVVVTAAPGDLARLDTLLWTFEERAFVPHVRVAPGSLPAHAARTPIWLLDGGSVALPDGAPSVLLNLGAAPPEAPAVMAHLTRVIEVLGTEAEALAAGRQRWRAYQARGLSIKHHPAGGAVAGGSTGG